jgi:hypothetical protein
MRVRVTMAIPGMTLLKVLAQRGCHPERSEGPRFLLVPALAQVPGKNLGPSRCSGGWTCGANFTGIEKESQENEAMPSWAQSVTSAADPIPATNRSTSDSRIQSTQLASLGSTP